jgi:hypothetical protein
MKKGSQEKIVTPGHNKRRNVFVTLFWPPKRYGFVWNRFTREEEEQRVQAPPRERPPTRQETRREEDRPLHGPCPITQDEEREEVHPRAWIAQDEAAAEAGPTTEPHRMAREQTSQIRRLLEPIVQEHRRGRREYDPFPQTTQKQFTDLT